MRLSLTVRPRMIRTIAAVALLAALGQCAALARADEQNEQGGEPRCFEMRTYTAPEGKLDALHQRFREHTNDLFEKHGMTLIGYWTPMDEPESENTLVYILAYPSREARQKSWAAFLADPEWQAVYKESRKDGPLVEKVESKFLTPTDYSPIR